MMQEVIILASEVGLTIRAFPTDETILNWANRISFVEDGAPNRGRYRATLDTTRSYTLFLSDAQPTDWTEREATLDPVSMTSNNIDISFVAKTNSVR